MTQQILPSRKRLNKGSLYPQTFKITDLIKFFEAKYGTPKKSGCKKKVFRAVIREFNSYLAERLISGDRITLPYNLGCLDVVKLKQKFEFEDGKLNTKLLLVDWNKTWNYWKSNEEAAKKKKLIYFTNEHTDNYRYKFNWDKCSIPMGKARMYSFNPSDLLSDKLGEYLLDPETIKNYPEKC